MTQTPSRDWQKDMGMCEAFIADQGWSRRDLIAEQPQMTMYWLQEAKKWRERYEQRPTFELLEAAQSLYEHHNARADAAEDREQRLKEVVKRAIVILDEIVPHQFDIQTEMEILLSALYPDTPAPKEGE